MVTWEPINFRIPLHNTFRAIKVARESTAFLHIFFYPRATISTSSRGPIDKLQVICNKILPKQRKEVIKCLYTSPARTYPTGFCIMKNLKYYSSLDWMLVHHRITPPPPHIKFGVNHLYTCIERSTVIVNCLAQEHKIMSPRQSSNSDHSICRVKHT